MAYPVIQPYPERSAAIQGEIQGELINLFDVLDLFLMFRTAKSVIEDISDSNAGWKSARVDGSLTFPFTPDDRPASVR
jgi:hypothetical protein